MYSIWWCDTSNDYYQTQEDLWAMPIHAGFFHDPSTRSYGIALLAHTIMMMVAMAGGDYFKYQVAPKLKKDRQSYTVTFDTVSTLDMPTFCQVLLHMHLPISGEAAILAVSKKIQQVCGLLN